MAQNNNKDKGVYAELDAAWLNTPSPFAQLDDDWIKIIIFYVFHVPVSGLSARGGALSVYKWGENNNKNDFKILKAKLMLDAGMCESQFCCVESIEKMREALVDNNLYQFPKEIEMERVTYRKTKTGINDSLLAHIRNSFAHGRLSFYDINNEIYVAMEDLAGKNQVSARMILSKTTLLKWKETIEDGPAIAKDIIKKKNEESKLKRKTQKTT